MYFASPHAALYSSQYTPVCYYFTGFVCMLALYFVEEPPSIILTQSAGCRKKSNRSAVNKYEEELHYSEMVLYLRPVTKPEVNKTESTLGDKTNSVVLT